MMPEKPAFALADGIPGKKVATWFALTGAFGIRKMDRL
jgi:hypothetical protein